MSLTPSHTVFDHEYGAKCARTWSDWLSAHPSTVEGQDEWWEGWKQTHPRGGSCEACGCAVGQHTETELNACSLYLGRPYGLRQKLAYWLIKSNKEGWLESEPLLQRG